MKHLTINNNLPDIMIQVSFILFRNLVSLLKAAKSATHIKQSKDKPY